MSPVNESPQNSRGRLLEYAEFIEEQIHSAQSRIKSNDLFRAVLWIITGTMALLFIEIVLDHSIELPLIVRQITLFAGLLVAIVYGWIRVIAPWLRRINPLFAAKSIETVDPQFKNSLINYLQISQDADKVAPSVLAQMEARAVADLSRVDVNNVVDPTPVTRLSYAMAALIVGFCLYSWITPKSLIDSARRAFLADIQRPTNTRFANIRPGDLPDAPRAITGMPLEFTVETLGAQPAKVTLFISRDEGKTFAEIEMKQGGSFADPWSVTIDKLPGELHYYMAGGDGRTRTYKLDPVPVAIVEKMSLDYDFPEYTSVPRREGVEEGNIEALQGTWITVHVTTNQAARSGFLDFKPDPPVPLAITPGDPRKLTGRFLVENNGQYAVRFNSVDGQANPEPVIYDIKVVKDLSPTARFIRPESPTQRPANARVPLVIDASDDFGLKSVQLHVHKNGEILQQAEELIDQKSNETVKQLQRTVSLDLQPLSVKPGDKVQYWLTLRDNCDLQPNKFETPKQVIEIIDPVSEPKREELAQNEMAQAREQTGQQDPMNQQGNQGDNQQNPDQNPDQNQQNQQAAGKNGDPKNPEQKKEQEKQQGKSKNSQGDASEAADPSENAREGGKEAPDAKPQPSDSNKQNQPQSKSKNNGQTGASSPDNNQNKQQQGPTGGSDQNNQPDNKNPDQPEKSQQPASKNQQKNAGKANDPDQENSEKPMTPGENPGQQKDNPEKKTENAQSGENQLNPQQKTGEKSQPGQNKPNEPGENGEKPMTQPGEKGENKQTKGGDSDTKSAQNKQNPDVPKPGDPQKGSGEKSEGDQNQSKELPKGNPDEMKNGEPGKNQPRDVSAEDRQKLDKLRKALGLDKEPQDQPVPDNNPAGDESKQGGDQQKKPSDQSKSGGEDSKDGEKSKSGDESKQGGDQQKKPSDQSKSGGEDSKDGEKSKSGDESKQGGDQQKKSGDESKQGEEQGKSAQSKKSAGEPANESGDEQKKGNAEKSGGDSQKKGEGQKSGDDQPRSGDESKKGGDQEKSASTSKSEGEQAKSGDARKTGEPKKQGGDQPKGKGQGDGEKPDGNTPEEQQKGSSEKSGEEKGRPGELPRDTPKAGGMREGGKEAEKQADTSTPTERSQEPDQPGESNNLTPQQKADQRLLKRLREMVKRDEITKDLEEATGLSREEIDQFVRRYEPPAKDERTGSSDGPGEILTKQSGQDKERRVNLPANLPGGQVTSRTARNSGMVGDDTQQGNFEGARSRVPSALRARFEAYQKSLSRSGGRAVSNAAPAAGSGSAPAAAPSASATSGSGQPGSR